MTVVFGRIKNLLINLNRNTSIITKTITISLCMVIIPLIVSGVLYYKSVRDMIKNEMLSTFEQMVDQYVKGINFKMNVYTNTLYGMIISDSIQDALSANEEGYYTDFDKDKKVSNIINSIIAREGINEIEDITVYVERKIFFSGVYTRYLDDIRNEEWYRNLKVKLRYTQWFITDEDTLALVKPISSINPPNTLDILGLARFDINLHKLFHSAERLDGASQYYFFILDASDQVIYSDNPTNASFPVMEHQIGNTRELRSVETEDGNLVVARNIEFDGWKAVFVFPMQTVNKKVIDTILIVVISVILLGGFSVLVIAAYSRSFSRRLKLLLNKIESAKKGHLGVEYTIQGKDEIGIIDHNFNDMASKLNTLIKENYLVKIAKREAELKALQIQINPHFLYNTLECISAIANVRECTEIHEIARKLGEILRYNIHTGKNELVPLEEEIRQMQNYIDIQIIRFGKMFEFFVDIPEELNEYKVLKFILQPVVENTIQHGFKDRKFGGSVEITASEEEDALLITIQDNGAGISEERLAEINEELRAGIEGQLWEKRKSIGLQNVNSRIILFFGEKYGLEIKSAKGEGTTVVIRLPKIVERRRQIV